MTAREPPQLHADGDLDGGRGEVLLLLAGLELHEHLVELREVGCEQPPGPVLSSLPSAVRALTTLPRPPCLPSCRLSGGTRRAVGLQGPSQWYLWNSSQLLGLGSEVVAEEPTWPPGCLRTLHHGAGVPYSGVFGGAASLT